MHPDLPYCVYDIIPPSSWWSADASVSSARLPNQNHSDPPPIPPKTYVARPAPFQGLFCLNDVSDSSSVSDLYVGNPI
ncbi:jg15570 [Pararge aegeria aegeria]|uniref:Jg15570 protein n=1 Tax=Pararge aegeria aegeria TaxID=348720 RepID=A0A8S4RU38_9NEOP|nr:jg15570 [Pararge aegeria aegeria]